MWWIDPILTIAVFAWLGLGVIRYQAQDDRHAIAVPQAPKLAPSAA